MKPIRLILLLIINWQSSFGQATDTLPLTNKDAVFKRPFILETEKGGLTASVGGYLEANTNYFATDGVGEGFSMEMRRFNLFFYSTIGERIKFLSELEFEHGTEEIALETALLDFEIQPTLIFRAGIVLTPIGYFNQNHDSPKWEFIDRPLVSTTIIPATLSELGFGFHGKIPLAGLLFTYETYLVNGLQDGIVANEDNRISLRMGKTAGRFEEDNNGSPAITGRIGLTKRNWGEVGFSAYSGIYNAFKKDGLRVDDKRRLNILAVDFNFSIKKLQMLGELAFVKVEVPQPSEEQYGSRQWGIHTDLLYPLWQGNLLDWENVRMNIAFRFEFADYNTGQFQDTGTRIYDEITALVPGLSLRFSPNTLLRANYRYHWERDFLGNPTVRTAGFQFGFASYF